MDLGRCSYVADNCFSGLNHSKRFLKAILRIFQCLQISTLHLGGDVASVRASRRRRCNRRGGVSTGTQIDRKNLKASAWVRMFAAIENNANDLVNSLRRRKVEVAHDGNKV
jgi:hypothetical protein